MTAIKPEEKFAASKPRRGDPITYKGAPAGNVRLVEHALCWYGDGAMCIWCFSDGLNNLHDWPTKRASS